jgi:hypothetical protein
LRTGEGYPDAVKRIGWALFLVVFFALGYAFNPLAGALAH